jgi:hypothetical protein
VKTQKHAKDFKKIEKKLSDAPKEKRDPMLRKPRRMSLSSSVLRRAVNPRRKNRH